jgi:type IV secretory pathway TrbD component
MGLLAMITGVGLGMFVGVTAGFGLGHLKSGVKRAEEAAENDPVVQQIVLRERLKLKGLIK